MRAGDLDYRPPILVRIGSGVAFKSGRQYQEHIGTLHHLEFVNRKIYSEPPDARLANGQYHWPQRYVELSRVAARNWSNTADELNHRLALQTIWHELAHHVWFEDAVRPGAKMRLRGLWESALESDSIEVPQHQRTERFAEMFGEYMSDPALFRENRPHLADFYRDHLAHSGYERAVNQP